MTEDSSRTTVYADLRALQDSAYPNRGIGSHIRSLLTSRGRTPARDWFLVGLLDPELPTLGGSDATLCDDVQYCVNPHRNRCRAVFIDTSPMTHDALFGLPLTARPDVLTASIVYDFIPLDRAGYFGNLAWRIEYFARLARLRRASCFFPISRYAGCRLAELTAIQAEQVHITGVAVRPAFASGHHAGNSARSGGEPYLLVVAGDEPRKNASLAVHSSLRLWAEGRQFRLRMMGSYTHQSHKELHRTAGSHATRIDFLGSVSDAVLLQTYQGALATIVPSHIEGFSLPVVEAAACGSPVLASSCEAHMELVSHPSALFPSHDDMELAARIRACLDSPALREEIAASQRHLASEFSQEAVGGRFWGSLAARLDARRSHTVKLGRKPKIALFSPYPPDRSGVARYSAVTFSAVARRLEVDLYTDAQRPLSLPEGIRDAGLLSALPLSRRGCDATVFVVGNSQFHFKILDLQERFGGPCILHDSRLTQAYCSRLGEEEFRQYASRLLDRRVSEAEADRWLRDRNHANLFLEPVLEKAKPLIVHTPPLCGMIQARYRFTAELAPFVPIASFASEELSPASRRAARERLGISSSDFLVASFGFVDVSKAPVVVFGALRRIRDRGVPAVLHWVGGPVGELGPIRKMAEQAGLQRHVRFFEEYVTDEVYRDYLLAADAAVQLRVYDLGQASAAVADCAAAGLPAVASQGIADACGAPSFIRRVPQECSPAELAKALEIVWGDGPVSRNSEARREYLSTHSPEEYARRFCEILGYG